MPVDCSLKSYVLACAGGSWDGEHACAHVHACVRTRRCMHARTCLPCQHACRQHAQVFCGAILLFLAWHLRHYTYINIYGHHCSHADHAAEHTCCTMISLAILVRCSEATWMLLLPLAVPRSDGHVATPSRSSLVLFSQTPPATVLS